MTDDLKLLLDKWKALETAVSEGPWSATHGPGELPRIWSDAPQFESAEYIAQCAFVGDVVDAEFIAASRTLVPRLIASVEAVLAEHPATQLGCITHYARSDCECETRLICSTCAVNYPCPTVTTIHNALIGDDDDR